MPENLVSRDGFGSPAPRQPAHLHTQAESGAYLRDSFRVPRYISDDHVSYVSVLDLIDNENAPFFFHQLSFAAPVGKHQVIGVDYSASFVRAARRMQEGGRYVLYIFEIRVHV